MSDYIVVHSVRVAKDFVPETVGRLTTVGPKFLLPVGNQSKRRNLEAYQVCQCSCGSVCVVQSRRLSQSLTRSCGCLKKEIAASVGVTYRTTHGFSYTDTYSIWAGMLARCLNNKSTKYPKYGDKGITVCARWLEFANFLADMGTRPSPQHSIDRYPNRDGNYEPGNVRWATNGEQSRNMCSNRVLTHNGKTQCMKDWATETGIHVTTIHFRLKSGWSVDKALTTPPQRRNK